MRGSPQREHEHCDATRIFTATIPGKSRLLTFSDKDLRIILRPLGAFEAS